MLDIAQVAVYIGCENYPSRQMRRCRFFIAIFVLLHLPGLFLIAQDAGRIPDYPPFPDSAVSRHARLDQSRSVAHSKTALDSNLTLVGEWLWGDCYTVELHQDTLALIGNGQYVHILNAANPDDPVIVGEYLTDSYVKDIVVRDSLCYVLSGRSFLILDISDHRAPEELSSIDIGGSTARLILDGPYAYVQVYNALVIVDISNPFQPVKRASHALGEHFFSMASRNGYVYVGYGAGAITHYPRIFDVRNPNAIISLGDITRDGLFAGVAVQDTFLFLAGYVMSPFANAIKVFSISDPANPVHLVTDTLGIVPDVPYNIVVRDTLAFVTMSSRQISVFDISDIYDMRKLTGIIRPGAQSGNYKVSVSSRLVAAAQWNGSWLIERVDENSLRSGSFFLTGGRVNDVIVRDSIAYLTHLPGAVSIVSVSNPALPKWLGGIELENRRTFWPSNSAARIALRDSLAYVTTSNSIEIIDIQNPTAPMIRSFVPTNATGSVVCQGNFLFVAQYDSGVTIFDVTDPLTPIRVGMIPTLAGHQVAQLSLEDTLLYFVDTPNSLKIVDVSVPHNPMIQDSVLSDVRGFILIQSYLYALEPTAGSDIWVYSLQDSLHLLGSFDIFIYGVGWVNMSVSSKYLYMGRSTDQGVPSLLAINVADPEKPTVVGSLVTTGFVNFIFARGPLVYFGDDNGLRIVQNDRVTLSSDMDFSLPVKIWLHQNFPNPFNNSTSLSFEVPTKAHVALEVFDLLGRKVAVLIDSEIAAGSYRSVWKSEAEATGIYLIRYSAGRITQVRKAILMK